MCDENKNVYETFRMDDLADLEKRDAEINKALALANSVLNKPPDVPKHTDEENIDQLIGNTAVKREVSIASFLHFFCNPVIWIFGPNEIDHLGLNGAPRWRLTVKSRRWNHWSFFMSTKNFYNAPFLVHIYIKDIQQTLHVIEK